MNQQDQNEPVGVQSAIAAINKRLDRAQEMEHKLNHCLPPEEEKQLERDLKYAANMKYLLSQANHEPNN